MEILTRLLMSLIFAGLFSGLPALFCLLLILKVKNARRTGVWIGKWGRRWTRDSDPERFETFVRISTVQAVALGILACVFALCVFAIFMQSPIKPSPASTSTESIRSHPMAGFAVILQQKSKTRNS